jgi:hypothetical protein
MAKPIEVPIIEDMSLPSIQPVLRKNGGIADNKVVTNKVFWISIRYLGKRYLLAISPGFDFDGASIPRAFWVVVGHPLTPSFLPGALTHDGLYGSELLDRHTADLFFHAILDYCKVRNWKSDAMFRAVDLYGGLTWERHTTQSIEENRKFVRLEVTDL